MLFFDKVILICFYLVVQGRNQVERRHNICVAVVAV